MLTTDSRRLTFKEIMQAWRRANEAGWTDDMIYALLEGLDEAIELEALDGGGRGSSHCVYKTPWDEDPRVNIQNRKGNAKPYQVRIPPLPSHILEDRPRQRRRRCA